MSNLKFGTFDVHVVEDGTEIEQPHPVTKQMETVIVTDGDAVYSGRNLYLTKNTWEKVKAEAENLTDHPNPTKPEGRLQ